MIINLPADVNYIINRLQEAGYEAYAVGGCVRDSLLGREPSDWDITTSAKPDEIKALFKPTIDTGIQHGTVTVLRHNRGYEVTTYRIDGEYKDNRHPEEVTFTTSLREDLRRRDFTINAMAYNDNGLVDEFDGIGDIDRKIIRCVGDPDERFGEDALRMMRAVRFSAQLGYMIHEDTRKSVGRLHANLESVSAERINVELTKMLMSDHPEYIRDCYELGITSVVLSELDECMGFAQNNPHHCYDVGEHIIQSLIYSRPDRVLRYALLFHDLGKPECATTDENGVDHFHGHGDRSAEIACDIMHRLKFDNDTIHKVEVLVRYHDWDIEPDKRSVRRALNKLGTELFLLLLEVKQADVAAQSDYKKEEKLERLEQLRSLYDEIIADSECIQIKDLAINGGDLIAMGMQQGPELGQTLNKLLDMVLDDPAMNTRSILMSRAYEIYTDENVTDR
ncbi:MAG: HD domain-containing protein [Lachnospiraceae bacterium]|nr:HD domain-containing protein [Lachnospiraceae bacterium]